MSFDFETFDCTKTYKVVCTNLYEFTTSSPKHKMVIVVRIIMSD